MRLRKVKKKSIIFANVINDYGIYFGFWYICYTGNMIGDYANGHIVKRQLQCVITWFITNFPYGIYNKSLTENIQRLCPHYRIQSVTITDQVKASGRRSTLVGLIKPLFVLLAMFLPLYQYILLQSFIYQHFIMFKASETILFI